MDMNKYELIKDLTVEELKKLVEISKINKSFSDLQNEHEDEIDFETEEGGIPSMDSSLNNSEVESKRDDSFTYVLNDSEVEIKRDDSLKYICIVFDKITEKDNNDTTVHLAFISHNIKEVNQFIDSCCDAMRERYYNEITITYGGIFHKLSARMGGFHHEMSVEYRDDIGSEYDPKWYIENFL